MATCHNCQGTGVSFFGTCANCKGSGQEPTGEPADWLFGSSKKPKKDGCGLWLILAMLLIMAAIVGGLSL